MFGEGLAQGRPTTDALAHVLGDGTEAGVRGEAFLDAERAIEGEAGLEEGGKLLGEGDEVTSADTARAERRAREARHAETLALEGDLDGKVRVALELLDDAARVGRLHHAVHRLAPPVSCLVREERHATAFSRRGGSSESPHSRPIVRRAAPARQDLQAPLLLLYKNVVG